jgi:hypothetical protein
MVTIDDAYLRSVLEDLRDGKIDTETAAALVQGRIDQLLLDEQVDQDSSTVDLRRRVERLERS